LLSFFSTAPIAFVIVRAFELRAARSALDAASRSRDA
jgi:hypothetical protein